jgi:hypothetical protein
MEKIPHPEYFATQFGVPSAIHCESITLSLRANRSSRIL